MNKPARKATRRTRDVRIVLRAPNPPSFPLAERAPPGQPLIKPVERGLAVLDAFLGEAQWLANQDIAAHTGLPRATVSRLSQTLATLGYLRYCERRRKYRLAPSVLSLGYGAIADTDFIGDARPLMQQLADENGIFVALARRDGLDMVLVANCHSASNPATVGLGVGEHMPIAASPVGWALLACLHENERSYLMDHMRAYHKREEWMAIRQKISGARAQIAERGCCVSTGDWGPGITVAAAPLRSGERLPMVLLCAWQARTAANARADQKAVQRLAALARELRDMEPAHE